METEVAKTESTASTNQDLDCITIDSVVGGTSSLAVMDSVENGEHEHHVDSVIKIGEHHIHRCYTDVRSRILNPVEQKIDVKITKTSPTVFTISFH